MKAWIEDIVLALKNLGGKASLTQIYDEVRRIREEPLPQSWKAMIRFYIESYSSDSEIFKGVDNFQKIDRGIWALRDRAGEISTYNKPAKQYQTTTHSSIDEEKGKLMATWVEDIVQAMENLGGEATESQIRDEVKKIRGGKLPASWANIINHKLNDYSSDSSYFKGIDIFHKVEKGEWVLREQTSVTRQIQPVIKRKETMPNHYLPTESLEEIENILRTIKQYRDYEHPDSPTWKGYVDEFFHILGFSTEEKNPRLMTLNVMGANHTPRAIVGFVHPGENFEEMVPGLSWESYLFFAAQYYQINWGILTDGLRLKIVQYQDQESKQPTYWSDFDGVICQEKIDTFCTIHKMFSYIKGEIRQSIEVKREKKKVTVTSDEDDHEWNELRFEFWEQLLIKAKIKANMHMNMSPRNKNWIDARTGKRGLSLLYVVRKNDAQVDLYIDRGEVRQNKRIFYTFYEHKNEIEAIFGDSLDWRELPNKRASRIVYVIESFGLNDTDHWDQLQDQMIDAMIRLEKALHPYIQRID